MTIFTTLPPDELSDNEKVKLVDEVLNQDFNELSDAEKRGFYTSAISKGLKPDWPLRPEKLFTRDDKLRVFFPNFLKENKIVVGQGRSGYPQRHPPARARLLVQAGGSKGPLALRARHRAGHGRPDAGRRRPDQSGGCRRVQTDLAAEDQKAAVLNSISTLLHETYPGKKWIEPILPDLLGEHLVQVEVKKDPDALFDLVFGARDADTVVSPEH